MAKLNMFGERRQKVEALAKKYPYGTQLKFKRSFTKTAIEPERYGKVLTVDNMGVIIVKADNGERVRLIPDIDSFVRLNENDLSTESRG